MKKYVFLIMLISVIASLAALELQIDINANAWQDRALYPVRTDLAGEPAVPFLPVKVILPYGHKIESLSLELEPMRQTRSNLTLDYIREPQPSSRPTADLTTRSEAIYRSNSLYPALDHEYLGTQYYRGVALAIINIYPFKYNPVERSLYASGRANIRINTIYDATEADYQARYLNRSALSELTDICVNPETTATYRGASSYRHSPQSRLIDLSSPRKMIIITDPSRTSWFTEYSSWRSDRGISNAIFTTTDIYSNYQGIDNAEKVRNFINDAYLSWIDTATPLEYVILGGDDEVVPERGAYGAVGSTIDNRMPVDLYYGCLDGNWNANNNNIWGENNDNVDMIPELHVGRFPAESLPEFNNIFRKIRYYVDNDTYSNNIAMMYGENLNNNPLTWGGDYKDDVAQYIPDTYYLETHYQRDGTYNENIVWNTINQGVNVMNHMGHANEFFLMGQGNNTIEALQNTEYGFLYSQGCYPAAFDQRTSGDSEAIGEHLLTANGAVMAFIGNTRYGWYMPGSIDGASQFYDRQYFIGLYNNAILELGKALTFSRLQNLNAAMQSDVMRWCYFEQVLFGDPSVSVKFPDAAMPYLSLTDYSFTDEEGDNDGILNPGEIIRFYPEITNHADWNTAYNVTLQISGLPAGSQILSGCPTFASIAPGETVNSSYVSIQLPQNMNFGNYSIKITIHASHPQTQLPVGSRVFEAGFEITLMDNRFPWDCQIGSKSAPIVYPFGGEELEIAYLDSYGRNYLINSEGLDYLDFAPDAQQNIMRSSALGMIDGDNLPDIVVASRTGLIYATNKLGSIIMQYQAPTSFLFTPVLADLNGDSSLDVIAGGLDGKIYAVNASGNLLPGFPVDLGSTFQSEIAVGSFGSPSLDIVAGTVNGMLYRISSQGAIRTGFPVNLGSPVTGSPGIVEAAIIAGTNSNVYRIESDGSIFAQQAIAASMAGGAVFGDIAYNDKTDLAFVTINGMLYAMDSELNNIPGFPVNTGVNFNCPPLLANLDNDPRPEIILHSYINSVFIYDHSGASLEGFPFVTSYNGATPATLVDFDDNGYYKLVAGYSTGVLVVNLRKPAEGTGQWMTYRGGLMRQGSYEYAGFVSSDDPNTPEAGFALAQNYPNPFAASTTISYKLSSAGNARIDIFNLRGQLVRSLVNSAKAAGSHTIEWDGKDSNGSRVANGIYMYRLSSPEGTLFRKMLMIRGE
jgi:hypothetical protein